MLINKNYQILLVHGESHFHFVEGQLLMKILHVGYD